MDLRTLSDELMMNIIEKITFPTLTKLRKMNKQIDDLAKCLEIANKVPVEELLFHRDRIELVIAESDTEYLNLKKERFEFHWNTFKDHREQLVQWFAKVKIKSYLRIDGRYNTDETGILAERTIDIIVLLKNIKESLRYVTCLELCAVNLLQPMNVVIPSLAEILPRLNFLEFISCRIMDKVPINWSQCLATRKWKRLYFCCMMNESNIILMNDRFLLDASDNCVEMSVGSENSKFTINGVINMFKKCVLDEVPMKRVFLNRVYNSIPFDELRHTLKFEIPGAELQFELGLHKMLYKTDQKKIIVEFRVWDDDRMCQ